MKFVNPYLLNLLWALIPVFAIMVYGILERKKILSGFAGQDMLATLFPTYAPGRRWLKLILTVSGAGLVILALCGPQWGYRWETVHQKGVDIIIALDCSKSMLAEDIKPNRLERAKREIMDLLHLMRSDRAGLVAFSGKALLQCPLTLDYSAFNIFLKTLTPGYLPVGGTDLAEALRISLNGFEKDSNTEKAVILITDGEDNRGDTEELLKTFAEQGIKIFCIGIGDPAGAPIPDETGGFIKDAAGNIVFSRLNEKGLEDMATFTGGAYSRSVTGSMGLGYIYKEKILGEMEQKSLTAEKQKVWENRFQWFLFPGLFLLLLELVLSPGRSPGRRIQGMPLLIPFMILILLGASGTTARAEMVSSSVKQGITAFENQQYEVAKKHFIDAQLKQPDDERHYYNIGTAAYMNKEYGQALKNFSKALASKGPDLRHKAMFNIANTHFRMENMDEAIKGYESVLDEFPDDQKAKENLEFARQKKKELEEQKQKQEQEQKQKQDSEKDQDKQDKMGQDANNQNRDDSDKSKQDQSKQNQSKQGNQENQKNKDKMDQSHGGGPEKKEQDRAQASEAAGKPNQENNDKQSKDLAEAMLNRLEDKPGSAMMPAIKDYYIEKDW
jgi:Ca-activated chloride channel homolog